MRVEHLFHLPRAEPSGDGVGRLRATIDDVVDLVLEPDLIGVGLRGVDDGVVAKREDPYVLVRASRGVSLKVVGARQHPVAALGRLKYAIIGAGIERDIVAPVAVLIDAIIATIDEGIVFIEANAAPDARNSLPGITGDLKVAS